MGTATMTMTGRTEASSWTSADAPVGRMPAEWEPHAGCFMGWPANPNAWGRDLADVQRDYVAVAQAIRQFEPVTMLVEPDAVANARRQLGTDIAIVPVPLNEAWLRDSGPSFVKRPDGTLAGVAWRFNGWGGASPDFAPDTLVARRLLGILGLPVVSSALAFEGGALHVDGEGTLLTTETVVFARNRIPASRGRPPRPSSPAPSASRRRSGCPAIATRRGPTAISTASPASCARAACCSRRAHQAARICAP
jgi:agmatine/peptidylarginine deiminase